MLILLKALPQMARVTRLELAASAVTEHGPDANVLMFNNFLKSSRQYLYKRIGNVNHFGFNCTRGLRLNPCITKRSNHA